MNTTYMDLSKPPLRWMVLQAGALGLRTRPFDRDLSRHGIYIIESLTWVWWPFEFQPLNRLTYTRRGNDGKETTRRQVFSNCEA